MGKAEINNKTQIAGVMTKNLKKFSDERGFFQELIRVTDDFFKEGFGQLSRSFMYPGIIKAWHVHRTQIDWWYCVSGNLKVALCDMRKESKTYKIINEFQIGSESDDIIIKIPPGVAHGCKVIDSGAHLLYVTSGTYDPKEEGRIPHNSSEIGYDWLKGPEIK